MWREWEIKSLDLGRDEGNGIVDNEGLERDWGSICIFAVWGKKGGENEDGF